MKTNNDGSDDHDRDDWDNRDDHDDNDATDSNDDDNNDADDGKNDSDDIVHINEDNGYKCTHARLHIHARAGTLRAASPRGVLVGGGCNGGDGW